jgi:four helix bundle protein
MLVHVRVNQQAEALKERTRQFALDVLAFVKTLPTTEPGPTIRRQLSKSSTGTAANYRAARRARSHAEFTARISIVAEEADESLYWLDLASSAKLSTSANLPTLLQEANELCAIFSAMVRTARGKERAAKK